MVFSSDKQEAFCHNLILLFSPTQTYLVLCQIFKWRLQIGDLSIARSDRCNKKHY